MEALRPSRFEISGASLFARSGLVAIAFVHWRRRLFIDRRFDSSTASPHSGTDGRVASEVVATVDADSFFRPNSTRKYVNSAGLTGHVSTFCRNPFAIAWRALRWSSFSRPLRAELYPRCGQPLRLVRDRPPNKTEQFICSYFVWYTACRRISACYGGIDGDWSRGSEIDGTPAEYARQLRQERVVREHLTQIACPELAERATDAGTTNGRK